MRILHTIPQFPYFSDQSIVGGSANALFNLASEQTQQHEVTILGSMPGLHGQRRTGSGVNLVPLPVNDPPGTARFGLRSILQTVAWVAKHQAEYDLVHGHSGFVDYLLNSRLSQSFAHKPAMHSLYCPIASSGGRYHRLFYKLLLRRSANTLAALTAFSRNVQHSMNLYGIKQRPIHVTSPLVDLQRFHPGTGAPALRARLGLTPDDFVLLFVGNTKPAKNLTTVLQALAEVRARLPTAKLLITTELKHAATDAYQERLAAQLQRLELSSAVIQLGIIDNMPELMRSSDVLVAPFLDTFGPSDYFMAALEALACGKPVVVSPVGGMPEVVTAQVGCLVDPLESTALAAALLDLAHNPAKRQAMGENAAHLAATAFAPSQAVRQFDAIYRSIM